MNKTILVIEDERFVRENICELLELKGYRVESADDGEAGLAAVRRQRPDLVICDIHMPRLNGYQVIEALRGDPAIANTPFIFLTARAEQADIEHGMALGANDYLTKPYTNQGLLDAIRLRLGKHNALNALHAEHSSGSLPPSRHDQLLLRIAAVEGNLSQIEQLANKQVPLDQTDETGNTPLMYAVMMRHIEIIKFLIDHGADPTRTNPQTGFSILKMAESMLLSTAVRYMRTHTHA